MTSTPELTTRDVLQQVDRRLSLIEEDLRALGAKLGTRIETLEAKVDTRIGALDAKIDTKFHLVVGLILASWFSTMGAFLLK
ncbi:MAG: hypothetical protein IT369_11470 [Candidatus Latescibacteria bacterium]|nr:hypothetical protein [Candidatus Latescibacterota bacterium]